MSLVQDQEQAQALPNAEDRAQAPVPQSATVHFNLTILPADVLAWVQKHRSDELMTTKEMTPYVDVTPNKKLDPTGDMMRLINYH